MNTKQDYQDYLNEIPVDPMDLESNGGRIPDRFANRLGDWTRRNDPIAFNVGYQDWCRECAI